MFLDPKENHESDFAHLIIEDQIQNGSGLDNETLDEHDQNFLSKKYYDEIWLMIENLKTHTEDDADYLDDLEDLNPNKLDKLGLDDDNFLSKELNNNAEDFKR